MGPCVDSEKFGVWCSAVWGNVTQGVAVCCSVLQCVAVCCRVLQCVAALTSLFPFQYMRHITHMNGSIMSHPKIGGSLLIKMVVGVDVGVGTDATVSVRANACGCRYRCDCGCRYRCV